MPSLLLWGRIAGFALMGIGFICAIAGKAKPSLAKTGLRLLLLGLVAVCALQAFCVYGSPKTTVTGTLSHVQKNGGRHAHSEFDVNANGGSHHISADYTGLHLKNGEQAEVTYLEYTNDLSDIQILSGPDAGWKIHEGTGNVGFFVLMSIMVILVVILVSRRKKVAATA